VVENVVSLLSKEFLGGIALVLELERESPKVDLGRGTIEQILLNLVVNASEAMQGNGKLKIIARGRVSLPDGEYVLRPRLAQKFVELSVVDSGPGIAPEVKDHIFEPFFTTKRTGSKVGTGLGLSLVYSMAQQAEAGLMVKSTLGQGAAFTLLFPAVPEPVRQTHSSQNDQSQ
jgi:signal transduction histidine kinase